MREIKQNKMTQADAFSLAFELENAWDAVEWMSSNAMVTLRGVQHVFVSILYRLSVSL